MEYGEEGAGYVDLSKDKIHQIESFLSQYQGNILFIDYGVGTEFTRCEITGLMADCVEYTAILLGE